MHKFLELVIEGIGWLLIALSPTLIGLGIGLPIYLSFDTDFTFVLFLVFGVSGFLIGAIWATREWKKQGTIWFLSRIMATPELDERHKDLEKR